MLSVSLRAAASKCGVSYIGKGLTMAKETLEQAMQAIQEQIVGDKYEQRLEDAPVVQRGRKWVRNIVAERMKCKECGQWFWAWHDHSFQVQRYGCPVATVILCGSCIMNLDPQTIRQRYGISKDTLIHQVLNNGERWKGRFVRGLR